MRPLKLFRRADDDRPTLKDRAAALKARLARITRRPDGSTDPQRRVALALVPVRARRRLPSAF